MLLPPPDQSFEQSLDARRRLARLDGLPVLLDEPRHVAQARLDVAEALRARAVAFMALGRDQDARRPDGVPLAQPAALFWREGAEGADVMGGLFSRCGSRREGAVV